jgi:lipoprotein-anchoring transpeptidase ErfK/SrfK
VRFRIVVVSLVATLAIGTGALLWPRDGESRAAAVPTTTTPTTVATTLPSTTTTQPAHAFEAADAAAPEVQLYDAPGASEPMGSLPNPTVENVPLAFLVKEHGPPGWLQVQIPRRPNESTAWIHAEDVSLRPVDNRIVVERDARRLTVYKGNTDQVVFQTSVATGAPATPTPLGNFYIDVVVKLTHPSGAYGPFQLSVAGFSDVLQTFGGGPGQIAIHGTNHPELIGEFVSNGCVRLDNDDITALEPLVPVGTPVQIVA